VLARVNGSGPGCHSVLECHGAATGQVRLLSLYVGATAGCQLAGCPPDHTAVAWMAYVTQAGVALGLIKSVVMHEPKWGPPFSALMIAVVVLNSMVRAWCPSRTHRGGADRRFRRFTTTRKVSR